MDDESYEQTMQELYDRSISYAPHESPDQLEHPLAAGDIAGGGATHVDADADVDPQQQQKLARHTTESRHHPGSSVFSSVVMKHKAARRRSSHGSLESQDSSSNSLTTGIAITSSPVTGGGAFLRGKKKAALTAARDHAHSLPIVSHDGWYDFGVQKGDESPRGRVRRRIFVGMVAILLVALAVAIVAVGVKSTENNNTPSLSGSESEKGSNATSSSAGGKDENVAATLCSASVLDSSVGRNTECARHCEQARCCFVDDPLNPQVDCTEDYTDFCNEFAPCKIIFSGDAIKDDAEPTDDNDGKELPHPPSDLHDICSSKSLSTTNGLAQCEMACLEAECCLPSVGELDSCFIGNEGTCDDYARYCYAVTGELAGPPPRAKVELAPPPENLDVMCDIRDGFSLDVECENSCNRAKCCWTTEPERSCYFQNAGLCKVYFRSCHIVVPDYLVDEDDDGDIGSFMLRPPPPPDNLGVMCTSQDDGARCEEACHEAECCWLNKDEPDAYCYHEYREVCTLYHKSCKRFFHGSNNVGGGGSGSLSTVNDGMGGIPEFIHAPTNLSQVCIHDSTPELRTECERLCEPAMCCLADPVDCALHGVDVACDEFEDPCSVLDLGANLARACLGTNPEKDVDLELCRELCETGRCCYEQEGSECSTSGLDVLCESYDPYCSAVFVDQEFLVVVGRGDSGSDAPPPELGPKVEEEIRHACKDLISTRSGWEACEELCEPYICCFDKTARSCDPNAEYRCGKWVLPCETLFQKDGGADEGSGEAEGSEASLEATEEHEKERPIRDDSLEYEMVKNDEYHVAITAEHEEETSSVNGRPQDVMSLTDTTGGTLLANGHCPVCHDEASCIHSYEPVLCGPNKECLYGNECEAICAGFVAGTSLSSQCVSFQQ